MTSETDSDELASVIGRDLPPAECPECGSAIEFASDARDRSIVLCNGGCGEWRYLDDV